MALGSLVRGIKSEQRRERQMTFVIDASAGTLTTGSFQATIAVNGVGDFTLTFRNAYGRAPVAIVSGAEADTAGYYANSSVSSIDILVTTASTGAPADQDVVVTVIGWDADDEV